MVWRLEIARCGRRRKPCVRIQTPFPENSLNIYTNDRFGKPLNVDTGSGVGDITGHSGTLLTVAFKAER